MEDSKDETEVISLEDEIKNTNTEFENRIISIVKETDETSKA